MSDYNAPSNFADWSDPLPLSEDLHQVPDGPGIYRILHSDVSGVHYIGNSKTNLQRRVRRLSYELKKDSRPEKTPHFAAPSLWDILNENDGHFLVSWIGMDSEFEEEEIVTAAAGHITLYKLTTGSPPTANFHRYWGGYKFEDTISLGWDDIYGPPSENWLGLNWRGPYEKTEDYGLSPSYPPESGIVLIWDSDQEAILNINVTTNIEKRMGSLLPNVSENQYITFSTVEFSNRERVEIEAYVAGAYYLANSEVTSVDLSLESEYTEEEIKERIRYGEEETTEFKKSLDVGDVNDKRKLKKEFCALANQDGGIILIGVSDNREIVGIDSPQDMEEWISDIISGNFPLNFNNKTFREDIGEWIVGIEVPKAVEKPYSVEDKFYIRNGPNNTKMDGDGIIKWMKERGLYSESKYEP
ncbi:AlbA family DNA-binding domain-containing protein [Haloterrigena salifodinae]|uniref:AlbA family DNA-binding domain-containing protein n=1 Tax=Haloterrigena salifodinae TaxID=2675099 RepID=UPI000F88468D|nr:ATP-binding protein [Haloterrigena salifodinae]